MTQNNICRNCDYVYDAAIAGHCSQQQDWTCPANFDTQSDNCLKRDELNDKEDFDTMEIKITVGLTNDDRALVREILAAIMGTKKAATQTEKQEPEKVVSPAPEEFTPEPAAETDSVAEIDAFPEELVDPKKIREEAIAIFRKKIKTHKMQIKALLAEYGAEIIKDVPDESLPTFFGRLKELVAAKEVAA